MALTDTLKKYFDKNTLSETTSQIWDTPAIDTMITNTGNISTDGTVIHGVSVDPTKHGITIGNLNDLMKTQWTTLNTIKIGYAVQPNYGNTMIGYVAAAPQPNVNWAGNWNMGAGALGSPSMNFPQANVGPSWGNSTGIIRYDQNSLIADFYSVGEITEYVASVGGTYKQSVVLTYLNINEQELDGGRFENYFNKVKNGTKVSYNSLLSDISQVIEWISEELEGNWSISKLTSDGKSFHFTFMFASKIEAAHFALQWL